MRPHLAPCLERLRADAYARWPGRDRTSDGWIGDTSHAARPSDHNPAPPAGIVRALDLDVDGMDVDELLADVLQDERTEYVIHAGLIYQRRYGFKPRRYAGVNAHHGHVHVSIRHSTYHEADRSPWITRTLKGPFMALSDLQQQQMYDALVGPNGSPQLDTLMPFGQNLPTSLAVARGALQTILDRLADVDRGSPVSLRQEIADTKTAVLDVQLALTSALPLLITEATTASDVDLAGITAAIVATIPDTIASDVVDALADRLRRTTA